VKTKLIFFSIAFVGFCWTLLSIYERNISDKIDYSSQVKPIINKHCIACHGGVKKAGGFGLLFRTDALAKTKSGRAAIIPFHPEQSDFIKRLTHSDPDERMPYRAEPLKQAEIEILTKWVKEGA
jgi:mono/diheme cytochrome c family protein